MIQLTQEQRQDVLNGKPVLVSESELGKDVVVLPAETFAEIQEILEENRQQRGFRQAGLRSALRWMKDNPY